MTYHPQTDGQTKRVNQVLEDMLHACVMNYQDSWDKCLPLAEFYYNNNYEESLKMTPFEALYGCRCHTPLNWVKPSVRMAFGPDLVMEAKEIVHCIQSNLKAAKSCLEHYANKRRRPLTFTVGDHMYLRVSPMRGVKRFGIKGKLAPHYIGLFLILEKLGDVAYKLELLPSLVGVQDVLHVYPPKKCLKAPADIVVNDVAPLEADLSYPEHPVKLLG
jgi:hypothetical protein